MTIEGMESQVRDAFATLRNDIDETCFCPRKNCALDRTLLMLASKSVRLGEAVCLLVRNGFHGEAFGLSRSCLEAFLIAKFIANTAKDPEGRASSYIAFRKAHYYNMEEIRKSYFPDEKGISQHLLDEAATIPNKRCWQTAYNMAMEHFVHPYNRDGAFVADTDYEDLYEHTSQYVHVTSVSLASHWTFGGEIFKAASRDNEEHLGILALSYSLGYVYMLCIISGWQFDKYIADETRKLIV